MSNLQPLTDKNPSFLKRIGKIWLGIIQPHQSIKMIGEFRRAQLFSILTLILSVLLISALFFRPPSFETILVLGGISTISYILSRTKYYRVGTYIFTYSFTAMGYVSIYQGTANSIQSAIATTVHVSLIVSSILLSQRGFLSLAALATLATFTAPIYSNLSIEESVGSTGGIVFAIGAILFGVQLYRANLEKEGLKEVVGINRELEDIKTNLEQRIGARTLELEKTNLDLKKANQQVQERAIRLQTISEISQAISSNVEQGLQELITGITEIIGNKLNFYHVGIFLLDENREYAVLRAANSQGGQRMLERRHQLKVGGTGIVGYVSQSSRPRIALNTGSDAVFFSNPDLPNTRSEMAVPLKYGSQTIGVLDIQSTLSSAFKDEDADLISTLANQIAIAINNSLVKEHAGFKIQKNRTGRRGEQLNRIQKQSGYSFHSDGTISTATLSNIPILDKALETGEIVILAQPSTTNPSALAVPVKFRDQVIGFIHIEAAEVNRKWTEDEVRVVQSISDRAAFALENARLFEETSRRAEQEETIAHITSQIGSSTDFNRIMQTTIEELGRTLGATRTFIQLEASSEDNATSQQPVTD
jgi:GAF domain-containing protein